MAEVPVIDLDALERGRSDELDRACRDWGVFHLRGHGLGRELCEATLDQARAFFALPQPHKRSVQRSAHNVWGFYDRELTKNRRDWKQIFDVGPAESEGPVAGARPQWPRALPELRPVLEAYGAACESLAYRVLSALCRNLGVADEVLHACFGRAHTSFLRLNYYPPCPDPASPDSPAAARRGRLGIHHHTDAGALTVLLQDRHAGLQVWRKGRWCSIPPLPGALAVNLGDVVQVWSNDRYRAPLHRVVVSARHARYSAAWFFNPSYDTRYAPLLGPARYRAIHWGEFRAARAAGDYSDRGEEIQISQFRIRPPSDSAAG